MLFACLRFSVVAVCDVKNAATPMKPTRPIIRDKREGVSSSEAREIISSRMVDAARAQQVIHNPRSILMSIALDSNRANPPP